MNNDETRKATSTALAAAKASLQTARISYLQLEKLREATRGPAPEINIISGLLGRDYDDAGVQAVLFPLVLHHRTLMGGHSEAASKTAGLRVGLDGHRRVDAITLWGAANDVGAAAWTGTLPAGLSTSSKADEVRRELGRPTIAVVDGVGEEQFTKAAAVYGFVFVDDAIAEVHVRRSV